ncbi:cysteine synthase family protein [Dickeya dianthicola]|uniref:cysteine synthase family protein n=1 Tax=Dickeya dianthicola TaxID=204039 RepID=UPI001F61F33C|nr:cysteine synthase family protein [Dickeya dianthicola]MCI4186562.1 cysteine synthase family protein [Dickeya dianthicola]
MELNQVGNTKLVQLQNLEVNNNKLFAKCEFQNPTGSHKDRTFLHIINTLEQNGKIKPGMTLVDCSTGNGGAALAWIGKEKGYKIKIFMPEGMTQERIDQIKKYGAELVETPKTHFLNGSVEAARKYSESNDNTYYLNQAGTILNMEAWYECGNEIVRELTNKGINPDYFVCSIGTGGTFSGIAKVLKNSFPELKTVGIEVDKSAPVFSKRNGLKFDHKPHNLMGLGAGVLSENTDIALIDEIKVVDGNSAWKRMKSFIECEGLGIGPTCGSNLMISEELMNNVTNKVIVTLFFDSAWKYESRWDGVYPEYAN